MYHIPAFKITLIREASVPFESRPCVNNPADVAGLIRKFLGDTSQENLIVVLLNTKNRVIGFHLVSLGTVDRSVTYPREIFKSAIAGNASRIAMVHNLCVATHNTTTRAVIRSRPRKTSG
jgi:DNA repair protein RadC